MEEAYLLELPNAWTFDWSRVHELSLSDWIGARINSKPFFKFMIGLSSSCGEGRGLMLKCGDVDGQEIKYQNAGDTVTVSWVRLSGPETQNKEVGVLPSYSYRLTGMIDVRKFKGHASSHNMKRKEGMEDHPSQHGEKDVGAKRDI